MDDSSSCRELADGGDYHKISFHIWKPRHPSECFSRWTVSNHADSKRYVEPACQPGSIFWLSHHRATELLCRAQEDNHLSIVEFELVQRPRSMGDNPALGGCRGNRRVGAAKRQAKYVVSSLTIGAAARADPTNGAVDQRSVRQERMIVLRGEDVDLRTGATSTRRAGPFQGANPGRNPPPQ